MARWNEDIDTAPSDKPVIVLAFSYYGARPKVGEAKRTEGIWRCANGQPIFKFHGGEWAEPDAWTEFPKATARQISERKRSW